MFLFQLTTLRVRRLSFVLRSRKEIQWTSLENKFISSNDFPLRIFANEARRNWIILEAVTVQPWSFLLYPIWSVPGKLKIVGKRNYNFFCNVHCCKNPFGTLQILLPRPSSRYIAICMWCRSLRILNNSADSVVQFFLSNRAISES